MIGDTRRWGWKDLLAIGFCAAWLCHLSAPVLRLLAGDEDSVRFASAGYAFLHQFRSPGEPSSTFFSTRFVMMLGPYLGPMMAYTLVPFVLLFGNTAGALHAYSLSFGCVLIAAAYVLSLLVFKDRILAFLSTWLLSSCPGFIDGAVIFTGLGVSVPALGLAGLCFLLLYSEDRRPWMAYAGCACLGWALASLSWFMAFLCGLALYAAIFHREIASTLPPRHSGRRVRFLATCFGAFSIFILPVLIYNIADRPLTLHYFMDTLPQGRASDLLRNYLLNLGTALGQLLDALGSYLGSRHNRWPYGIALCAAAATTLRRSFSGETSPRELAPWIILLGGLMALPLSPAGMNDTHVFAVLPLAFIALGTLAPRGIGDARRQVCYLLLLSFALWQTRRSACVYAQRKEQITLSGDFHEHDVATFERMLLWLESRPWHPVASFAWHFNHSLEFFSSWKIKTVDFPVKGGVLENRRGYFILGLPPSNFRPDARDFSSFERWREAVARSKRRLRLVQEFPYPDGRPAFKIYEVLPGGSRP